MYKRHPKLAKTCVPQVLCSRDRYVQFGARANFAELHFSKAAAFQRTLGFSTATHSGRHAYAAARRILRQNARNTSAT